MKSTLEPFTRLLAGFGVLFGVAFGIFQLWKRVDDKLPADLGPSVLLVAATSLVSASCAYLVFYSRLSLVWMSLVAILSWSGVAWCITR
jgi:hypothetical protein